MRHFAIKEQSKQSLKPLFRESEYWFLSNSYLCTVAFFTSDIQFHIPKHNTPVNPPLLMEVKEIKRTACSPASIILFAKSRKVNKAFVMEFHTRVSPQVLAPRRDHVTTVVINSTRLKDGSVLFESAESESNVQNMHRLPRSSHCPSKHLKR